MGSHTAEIKGGLLTTAYGTKMQEARETAGLSQSEAGRRLGKARETLSLLERGMFAYAPWPQEMKDYEELYGIPTAEQLSALGYPVSQLQEESLGEVSSLEVRLVKMFRRLEPSLRHRSIRLLEALLPEPVET